MYMYMRVYITCIYMYMCVHVQVCCSDSLLCNLIGNGRQICMCPFAITCTSVAAKIILL